MIWILVAVVVGLVIVVVAVSRSRGKDDGVEGFRRQIDALSPEARRTVVDQVKGRRDDVPGMPGQPGYPGRRSEPGGSAGDEEGDHGA